MKKNLLIFLNNYNFNKVSTQYPIEICLIQLGDAFEIE